MRAQHYQMNLVLVTPGRGHLRTALAPAKPLLPTNPMAARACAITHIRAGERDRAIKAELSALVEGAR